MPLKRPIQDPSRHHIGTPDGHMANGVLTYGVWAPTVCRHIRGIMATGDPCICHMERVCSMGPNGVSGGPNIPYIGVDLRRGRIGVSCLAPHPEADSSRR